jgi:hypothetical protein
MCDEKKRRNWLTSSDHGNVASSNCVAEIALDGEHLDTEAPLGLVPFESAAFTFDTHVFDDVMLKADLFPVAADSYTSPALLPN